MKRVLRIIACAFLLLSISACAAVEAGNKKITVAVGIVPEAAFVQKVAGDFADIVTLIPPGNSEANYQPTASEMQALSKANVYFTLQVPTEEANILTKIGDFNADILVVNLRDAAAAAYPLLVAGSHVHDTSVVHGGKTVDPHIWLSPKRAVVMVQKIADTLCSIDEAHSDTYKANAAAYIEEINALDSEIRQKVSGLCNKSFLIYHAAYGYFADDYGLEMVAIETKGKQATASEIQRVIGYAKQNGIDMVFYQEEFDDSQAQTVAEEINGSVVKTAPLSADYIGNLRKFIDALIRSEG
ncbi:MAG: metal ABC transporter solute-binding protein, Zn/Mn family [Christensenellales bacterium]|jgi:zinc transport system substrate-binding protein